MNYFRSFAQFETARSPQWAKERITDTLTSMPYVPDEKKAEKNSPTSDMFFNPQIGFRMYSNSFEPLIRVSMEETLSGCRVKMSFELPKTVPVFLILASVFCLVFILVMVIGGMMEDNSFPAVFALVYVPMIFGTSVLAFRLTCRHVLRRVTESLGIYEKVKLISEFDAKSKNLKIR